MNRGSRPHLIDVEEQAVGQMPCAVTGFPATLAEPLVVLDEEVDVGDSDERDFGGRWVDAKNDLLIHNP